MEEVKKYAYGYLRVSTEEQVDGTSLSVQKREIEKYAETQNAEIVGWYEDDGITAKHARRPELQRMLDDAHKNKGRIDFVIVYNLSRISRNLESYAKDIGYRLAACGVHLRSTTEPIDETPTGNLMRNIALSFHQFDNDTKSKVVTDNMKAVAENGWWQSQPPLGMIMEKVPIGKGGKDNKMKYRNVLAPDTKDGLSDKIATILNMFSTGNTTFMEVLRHAHKLNIRGKNGKLLASSTLERMLYQAAYCGYIRSKELTGYELKKANWDGIISKAVFDRNQANMKGDKRLFAPQPDETYPLKPMLKSRLYHL